MSASTSSLYVRSIFVSDFQSHQETKIELAPPGGLTILVGPTDSGKTAVVRGARLIYYNSPSGIEFIRVGRNMATVALEMSDSTKVARERSKSVNRYRITRPGQQPQVLEGFGLSVPQEVQEVTGVRTVSIGDSLDLALNLSEQLDGPFLGNKTVTGPTRAKILGSLAGTEEVDLANTAVGVDIHRAGQDVGRLTDEITALDARIAEYDYLPELHSRIDTLDWILIGVKQFQERLARLEVCRDNLAAIAVQRAQVLAALARWGGLLEAASHVECAEAGAAKLAALQGYKSSLERIHAEVGKWFPVAHIRWNGLEAAGFYVAGAEGSWQRLQRLGGLRADLTTTRAGTTRAQASINRWTNLGAAEACATVASDALVDVQIYESLAQRLFTLVCDVAEAETLVARWYCIDRAEPIVAGIPALTERLVALSRARDSLTSLRQARVVAEQDLSRHTKALGDAQSLYADTLVAMGACPLCGSTVSPESISLHVKEVA